MGERKGNETVRYMLHLSTNIHLLKCRRVHANSDGSARGSEEPAVHGITSHCSLPVVLLSVVATACGTAVAHNRRSTISCSGLHPLPSGLQQCATHWNSQQLDETTTGCSECHSSSGVCGSSPWPCHASTAQPSLVASGTASYLQNCCPHFEEYPWRCSSLPAKAMHSSGQHPWSSQTTVCFNWLHLATKSANVCCTTKLCLQWAGRVEQSASNTARQ